MGPSPDLKFDVAAFSYPWPFITCSVFFWEVIEVMFAYVVRFAHRSRA